MLFFVTSAYSRVENSVIRGLVNTLGRDLVPSMSSIFIVFLVVIVDYVSFFGCALSMSLTAIASRMKRGGVCGL